MKAKRKSGGGRKPRGPFSQNSAMMTVRMPNDLRDELERSAKKKGWSLTQELLWRMRDSFNQEHDKRRDPALRALTFVIAQLAERVSGGMYAAHEETRRNQSKEWKTDPFRFSAFKFAVGRLLDELRPPGEIRSLVDEENSKEAAEYFGMTDELAKLLEETHKTPEAYGAFAFRALWAQLKRATPLTQQEREMSRRYPHFGEVIEREFYGFASARRDLQLSSLHGGKP